MYNVVISHSAEFISIAESRKDLITATRNTREIPRMNTEAQGITNRASSLNRACGWSSISTTISIVSGTLVEPLFTKVNQPWVMVSLSWHNTAFPRFPNVISANKRDRTENAYCN